MAKNSQQDIDLLAQVVRSNPDFKLTKAVRDKLKAEVLKIEFAQASAASRNSKQLVTRQLDLPSTHDSDKVDRILREVEALKNSRHLGMYGTLSAIVNWDIGINHDMDPNEFCIFVTSFTIVCYLFIDLIFAVLLRAE